MMWRCRRTSLVLLGVLALGCGDDDGTDPVDGSTVDAPMEVGPAEVRFDLDGPLDTRDTFFDFPFPSDLRLTAEGTPDLTGYPAPMGVDILPPLLEVAQERPGWPTIPVGMFDFGAPLMPHVDTDVVAADPSSPMLLIDVDPESPERGALVPVVASTFSDDAYTRSEGFLSVAPRPGFVLAPERTYAFVVTTAVQDAAGEPVRIAPGIAALAAGETPMGARGADAAALYAPLWETLGTLGVNTATVAAATVFTTGDVVADTFALSERVRDAFDVSVDSLRLDPSDGAHDRYCELLAEVSMPQFQRGTPPFPDQGTFEIADGLPIEQRQETAKLVLTVPRGEMPEAGFPLMVYYHGSGGIASQVVDRGTQPRGGVPARGEGPAHVVAAHGFASAGASLPLSPDRLPGASAIEYLNLENLAAFRDTFRQGVLEQRLLLDALVELRIDPSDLGTCDGVTLPAGATEIRFDPESLVALGQSMGGMYTNMIGAVEPRFEALVPTGAGGHWSFFILETTLIPGVESLLGATLRVDADDLSFTHPAMHLLALAWEAAEPFVYMPRLSRRPLEGFDPRPVYEPVGQGDSFFPISVYDAVALAYGHEQAGDEVWPSMQDALALADLDGIIDYPVAQNLTSETGAAYTGAVVQYAGDGFSDPHVIFVQLDDVKYQYGCFLETQVTTGTAVIPAPAALGTPCPAAP